MVPKWEQNRIQQYIDNEIEESTVLDYKDARALGKSTGKKKEIAKDVSAMANTAGGVIIYGIREHRHLPKIITPIDRKEFPREWLDQVITHNIRPRIEELTIHSVSIDTAPIHVVYVVEIPQSTTAHQVTADKDYRYYERANFESVRMEDYRIRDVMNRATNPDADVAFRITEVFYHTCYTHTLKATVKNTGLQAINHFKLQFSFPFIGLEIKSANSADFQLRDSINEAGLVEHHLGTYRSRYVLFPEDEIGIGAQGIHPSCLSYTYTPIENYDAWLDTMKKSSSTLDWILHADDMPPKRGKIPFSELYGDL